MIVGLVIDSIEGNRKKDATGNIKISSNQKLKTVEKAGINIPNAEKTLSIKFEFETKYEPDIGNIKLGGQLLYQSDEADKILDGWKKERKLPKKVALEILNAIFRRCLLRTAFYAEELRLPPPLQLPVIKEGEKKEEDYIS